MPQQFTVVSHNACWYQGFPYDDFDPDEAHPEVIGRLTAIYQSYQPDVLCLQEIHDDRMTSAVAKALSFESHLTLGARYPIYGTATCAKGVQLMRDCHSNGALPERSWQICEVRAGVRKLNIANIHLTSGRFLTEEESAASRVADIQSLIDTSHGVDIICGDFNEGPRTALQLALEAAGFVDAAIVTGAELDSTGVNKPRSDQIWVRSGLASRITEFGATDWAPMAFDTPEKNVLSDHLPLWLKLSI
jgi:endonuclease/exonuclease/phosphatase family metal-dependent hydrolase